MVYVMEINPRVLNDPVKEFSQACNNLGATNLKAGWTTPAGNNGTFTVIGMYYGTRVVWQIKLSWPQIRPHTMIVENIIGTHEVVGGVFLTVKRRPYRMPASISRRAYDIFNPLMNGTDGMDAGYRYRYGSTDFPDGMIGDFTICNGEPPFIIAMLKDRNWETVCERKISKIVGDTRFWYNEQEYIITVEVEK